MTLVVFVHDGFYFDDQIPRVFAEAVWSVAHNVASDEDWSVLMAAEERGLALPWIESIFRSNGSEWTPGEQWWWRAQLGEPRLAICRN